jgi:ABC-type transport system substrate-binding protein
VPRRRRLRVRVLCPLALAGALAVSACGGSESPPEVAAEPTTTSTTEASTTTTVGREQEVLDAYLESWEAYDVASDPADPTHPALAETSTGPALQQAVESLEAFRISGRVGRTPENSIAEHRAEVVWLLGDEATVRDCSIDDGLVVIEATGEVVNDVVSTVLFEGSMAVEDGRWKLRSLKVVETWDGVAGCALAE